MPKMKEQKLYFICPTDCLEAIIDSTYKQQENYYYSSLGNSTTFNLSLLKETQQLIKTKSIKEITFVLANDNRIILDAIGDQDYTEHLQLNDVYYKILKHRYNSKLSWYNWNEQFLFLSSFINDQINEFKSKLTDLSALGLTINGQIYNRQQNIFKDTDSELIFMGPYSATA